MTAQYQREWRKRNPDKVKAYHKKRKAKQSAYFKKWYAENKGRYIAKGIVAQLCERCLAIVKNAKK